MHIGAVAVIHRFDFSLNENVHFHVEQPIEGLKSLPMGTGLPGRRHSWWHGNVHSLNKTLQRQVRAAGLVNLVVTADAISS